MKHILLGSIVWNKIIFLFHFRSVQQSVRRFIQFPVQIFRCNQRNIFPFSLFLHSSFLFNSHLSHCWLFVPSFIEMNFAEQTKNKREYTYFSVFSLTKWNILCVDYWCVTKVYCVWPTHRSIVKYIKMCWRKAVNEKRTEWKLLQIPLKFHQKYILFFFAFINIFIFCVIKTLLTHTNNALTAKMNKINWCWISQTK